MAAALALGASAFGRVGSSPTWGTRILFSKIYHIYLKRDIINKMRD